jgi:hypothetical protein
MFQDVHDRFEQVVRLLERIESHQLRQTDEFRPIQTIADKRPNSRSL